ILARVARDGVVDRAVNKIPLRCFASILEIDDVCTQYGIDVDHHCRAVEGVLLMPLHIMVYSCYWLWRSCSCVVAPPRSGSPFTSGCSTEPLRGFLPLRVKRLNNIPMIP